MNDFLNRITAQRTVTSIVNKETKFNFPLVGLSAKALERWKNENNITENSELLKELYLISTKLFFLGNKSQEQITDEYKSLSKNITELINNLHSKL
ncbi:hypothetical protein AB1278_13630 [Chryseobacterium sp. NRRL B-14798]|uniref:hypothetical protein n=1 Tax=Chryseobacterium sp. NRRL B-14798 TaxID=3162880 RepID=UPI003D2044C3